MRGLVPTLRQAYIFTMEEKRERCNVSESKTKVRHVFETLDWMGKTLKITKYLSKRKNK